MNIIELDKIFVPSILLNDIDTIEDVLAEMYADHPESRDDYILVDKINEEIVIKALKKNVVDEICKKIGCTPFDICMDVMVKQNKKGGC